MIYVFLANGFEETEAIAPIDILRRAELDVKIVGVESDVIVGSHGIAVGCDATVTDIDGKDLEMIVLPGGMPGTLNLEKSPGVQSCILAPSARRRPFWATRACWRVRKLSASPAMSRS